METKTLESIQKSIKEAETALKELQDDINKARIGGIDVTRYIEEASKLLSKINMLRTAYLK